MKNLLKNTVLVLTLIFISSCSENKQPKDVAIKFLEALNEQDYETAKTLGTEKTIEIINFKEKMFKMDKENGRKAKSTIYKNFNISKCIVNGDEASCHFLANGKDEKIDLIKINGEWKVEMNEENP